MRAHARRWSEQLAGWTIPEAILDQAPESPWGFLPGMFVVDGDDPADLPSRQLALAALARGVVLDIGCGGGAAALALVPPARSVIGVDERSASLADLEGACSRRQVDCRTILGSWPDVADRAPPADVVLCHHVLYNVADLEPFVAALTDHATERVVVELNAAHPLTYLRPLWQQFWQLDRPTGPRAEDALAVLREVGIVPEVALGHRPAGHWRSPDQQVRLARKRLCLDASRDEEIAAALDALPPASDEVWTFAWPGTGSWR